MLKVNPPYKPLVQLPYCCGVCSFQWILFRRGYWADQEEIAWYCKLKILKKDSKKFVRKMRIAKSKKEWGTSVEKFHIYANELLRKKKIPLKIEHHFISKIKNPREFVIKNLKAGHDIMLDFHWFGLGKKDKSWNCGHACVISEFDSNKNILTLGNPSQNQPKFWKVSLNKIVKAMDKKYDGHERGFWIINKR